MNNQPIRSSLQAGRLAFQECYETPTHGALPEFINRIASGLNAAVDAEAVERSESETTPHSNYSHTSETIRQISAYAPKRDRHLIMNTYVGIAHKASAYAAFHHDNRSGANFIAVDMRLSQLFNSYAKALRIWDLLWNQREVDNMRERGQTRALRADHIEEFWDFLDSEAGEWLDGPKFTTTSLYRSVPEIENDRNLIDSISECAEEFVIAHELMHALTLQRPRSEVLSAVREMVDAAVPHSERARLNDSQIEEINCDLAAVRLCIAGRRRINRSPEMVIVGAMVALTTIAHYNSEWSTPVDDAVKQTHPSITFRASSIWKYGIRQVTPRSSSRDEHFGVANLLSNSMTFAVAGAVMDSHRKHRIKDPSEHFEKFDYLKQDLLVQVLSRSQRTFFAPGEIRALAQDGIWPGGDFLEVRDAIDSQLAIRHGWNSPRRRT